MIGLNLLGNTFSNSSYDLVVFGLGAFIIVSILLWYYNRIPINNDSRSELTIPIYQSRDVLLQSKFNETNFIIADRTNSTWVKAITYILITIVIVTPFSQLLYGTLFL